MSRGNRSHADPAAPAAWRGRSAHDAGQGGRGRTLFRGGAMSPRGRFAGLGTLTILALGWAVAGTLLGAALAGWLGLGR